MQLQINKIYNIDCVEGLKMLDDECVDLTVTSPPYDEKRKYNGFEWEFEKVADELYRVTKEGGVVIWIVADATVEGSETGTSFRQALYFRDECGFRLHDTMIYAKEFYLPLNHDRYEQQFEYMFVFAKGKPKTFNPLTKPNKHYGRKGYDSTIFREKNGSLRRRHNNEPTRKEGIKPNIWLYKVGRNKSTTDRIAYKHPAIAPEQLVHDHILSWSNEGDIVLDPFMGSGTTVKMAIVNNRRFIGFEISAEYCEIARKRINKSCSKILKIHGANRTV